MEYVPTLLMILIIHFVSIGAGLLLIIGVFLRRKILMIPWLIIGEIIVAFWASMALVIIFLEGKLFQSGTSVFGLFTVLSLCLATMQAYFWILVQVSPVHQRWKCERCSPNFLRPISYFGSIWELHVLDLKTKHFCRKETQLHFPMDKGLSVKIELIVWPEIPQMP